MAAARHLVFLTLLVSTLGFPQEPEPDDVMQKTVADKKMSPDDVPCGNYLWVSTKTGTKYLYYFFGSTEWGKGKLGFYAQSMYRFITDEDKDPPTVRRVRNANGDVRELVVRLTSRERGAMTCLADALRR